VHAFASLAAPAEAATVSGLYADPPAARHVAVDGDGGALASAAKAEVIAKLDAAGLRAFALHGDANAAGCAGKPYAAYVFVSDSTFTLTEGTDLDVGLRLEDCGGWIVQEWHDHATSPSPSAAQARTLADQGVARLLDWAAGPRGQALLARGLDALPGEPPCYYYAMFKTVDGNMRLYVRAGGPAYDAGLRTNDIVDKLDGKFWWEYGTFQTQARAYDGKPHAFDVHRGPDALSIQLGAL